MWRNGENTEQTNLLVKTYEEILEVNSPVFALRKLIKNADGLLIAIMSAINGYPS
jgi:hypothetical protein